MTGNSEPSNSDGHDDEDENEDGFTERVKQLKVILETTLLLRRLVEWLIL